MDVHQERHGGERVNWLRAAVLGANDGIVSVASLIVGVAAAGTGREAMLVAGISGLVAGAMSMAAGEYVSVSSQADSERADIARETRELATQPQLEHQELTEIYVSRGLTAELAAEVARQLMTHDALGAHLRDELGLSARATARPVQAGLTSAASFAAGAAWPVLMSAVTPVAHMAPVVAGTSLACLAVLGALAARAGGAPLGRAALRVTFWGALAMLVTALVGASV